MDFVGVYGSHDGCGCVLMMGVGSLPAKAFQALLRGLLDFDLALAPTISAHKAGHPTHRRPHL